MLRKILLVSLLGWGANLYSINAAAWQAADVQECPVSKQNAKWLDCTPEDMPAKLPYKMDDGSVKVLDTRLTAFCKQGTCAYYYQLPNGFWDSNGDYAGQIQQQDLNIIALPRGYYLGNAKDGRIVAYLRGTGPENGGDMAPALQMPKEEASNNPEIDACVDQWAADFRKKNGNEAPIMFDFFDEWGNMCKEGKHP